MKDRVTLTIEKDLLKEIDSLVDGTTIKNRSHAVELYLKKSLKGDVPEVAVILAGGKTDGPGGAPKSLAEVAGKPVIQHNIDLLVRHGVKRVIVSLGHKASSIRKYLDETPQEVGIEFVEEKDPLGTAGPLNLIKNKLSSTFVMLNGDELKDINIKRLYGAHIENGAMATIALTTAEDVTGYGVALMDGARIVDFVEKPSKESEPSKLISAGLYILEPEVVKFVPQGYAMMEYDVFPKILKRAGLYGYPFSGKWLPIDTKKDIERARKEWNGFTS